MKLSDWAHKVNGYIPKKAFEEITARCTPTVGDLDSFINMYILNNIPNFIQEKPIAFDKVRRFIASHLEIDVDDIKLTGSAQLGFSLDPQKWLRNYSESYSDIDLFIISEKLFYELQQDIMMWKKDLNSEK